MGTGLVCSPVSRVAGEGLIVRAWRQHLGDVVDDGVDRGEGGGVQEDLAPMGHIADGLQQPHSLPMHCH